MSEGEVATIDHQSLHVTFPSGRPSSYSRATGNGLAESGGPPIKTNSIHFDNQTSSLAMPDLMQPTIVAQKPDPSQKPKDFVMCSCFVILCCNFIFGFLGYNYGVKSNHAWQLGDIDQARKRARVALAFDVVGILCGVATWVLAFTLYFACEPCNPFSMKRET